jgi:menaquinone-dependent protoporphyrinogen IX oxidase
MTGKNLKKTLSLTLTIALLLLSLSYLPSPTNNSVGAESTSPIANATAEGPNPIVVYYSRSGKTQMVARALMDQLSCEGEEIKSKVTRTGVGIITCVLDQLFDRDDQLEPLHKNLKAHNPIIVASPIWLGNLSSPARTFIKQTDLKDKEVYLFLTYNGALSSEKETALRKLITSRRIKLKEVYKIVTKEKAEEDIKKEVRAQLDEKPIVAKKMTNP